jgi:hypothetical protein
MAAARRKNLTTVKDTPLFDINEWIDTKRQSMVRVGGWNDSEIKYNLKKHPKKEYHFYLTIYFKKKTLMMIDNSKEPRVMIMQHRKDQYRILMTRSTNGYKVNQPSKSIGTYFVRCIVKIAGLSMENKITRVIEPVFHEKGISSGSIIEFKIEI